VQHEALLGFAFETLQPLHVVGSAQGGGHQRLGFAAGEDALPCVRGSTPASIQMSRTSSNARESGRRFFLDYFLAEDALAQHFKVLASASLAPASSSSATRASNCFFSCFDQRGSSRPWDASSYPGDPTSRLATFVFSAS
jgi:hypothetical protein